MYEYRVVTEDGEATHHPLNPWSRPEADEIAEQLRHGLAHDLFNIRIPPQRCTIEYRTVTEWAPVRSATNPERFPHEPG